MFDIFMPHSRPDPLNKSTAKQRLANLLKVDLFNTWENLSLNIGSSTAFSFEARVDNP